MNAYAKPLGNDLNKTNVKIPVSQNTAVTIETLELHFIDLFIESIINIVNCSPILDTSTGSSIPDHRCNKTVRESCNQFYVFGLSFNCSIFFM